MQGAFHASAAATSAAVVNNKFYHHVCTCMCLQKRQQQSRQTSRLIDRAFHFCVCDVSVRMYRQRLPHQKHVPPRVKPPRATCATFSYICLHKLSLRKFTPFFSETGPFPTALRGAPLLFPSPHNLAVSCFLLHLFVFLSPSFCTVISFFLFEKLDVVNFIDFHQI